MGNEREVKISPEAFDAAVKRHEEAFEKELAEVDVKKIVLKTKKAVLEQARSNTAVKQEQLNQMYQINSLESELSTVKNLLTDVNEEMARLKTAFTDAIDILSKQAESPREGGLFTKLWRWLV